MLKRIMAMSLAVALFAFLSTRLHAQAWGIQGSASVQTQLPTTTLGGGGPCTLQVSYGNSDTPLAQTSYNLAPPLVCSGSITAADPSTGALYSANATAQVSSVRVNNGMLNLAIDTQGGTADPNEINYVSGNNEAFVYWADELTFVGLPPGSPVLVQVSFPLQGSISSSGAITYGLDNALYAELDFGTNLNDAGLNCKVPAVTAISQPYIYPAATSQIINTSQSYLVCVPANTPIHLGNTLDGAIGGLGQWSGAVNANDATYIKVITPGVTLSAPLSGMTYSAPSSVPPSGSTCNGVYGGIFSGNIVISNGQNCTFVSGEITGSVQQNGGKLMLAGTTVGGDVQINGGSFSIGPSVLIDGEAQIQNIRAGATPNQVCGATVKGDLLFHNNGTAVQVGSASQSCLGNVIGGDLQVQNSSAPTQIYDNTVGANLHVDDNIGTTQVFNNSVTYNLHCQNNMSITGGGNAAEQKQGQCATF